MKKRGIEIDIRGVIIFVDYGFIEGEFETKDCPSTDDEIEIYELYHKDEIVTDLLLDFYEKYINQEILKALKK